LPQDLAHRPGIGDTPQPRGDVTATAAAS